MKSEEMWNKFCQTGRLDCYLRYRAFEKKKKLAQSRRKG